MRLAAVYLGNAAQLLERKRERVRVCRKRERVRVCLHVFDMNLAAGGAAQPKRGPTRAANHLRLVCVCVCSVCV